MSLLYNEKRHPKVGQRSDFGSRLPVVSSVRPLDPDPNVLDFDARELDFGRLDFVGRALNFLERVQPAGNFPRARRFV
jgi:hypothetical protein